MSDRDGKPARSELAAWETILVPGSARLPLELNLPDGFDPRRLETWPRVDGRLEWVSGRLLWMPPCGQRQAYLAHGVTAVWVVLPEERQVVVLTSDGETALLGESSFRGIRRSPISPLGSDDLLRQVLQAT